MGQKEFNWDGVTIWNISLSTSQRLMVSMYVPIECERELTLAEAQNLLDKAKFNVRLVQSNIQCPRCGKFFDDPKEISFIREFNECSTCDHLRSERPLTDSNHPIEAYEEGE